MNHGYIRKIMKSGCRRRGRVLWVNGENGGTKLNSAETFTKRR